MKPYELPSDISKLLSEKIDHLIVHQNKKLLEIQEVQTDYLEDLMKELKKK